MSDETISIRIASDKKAALDAIAAQTERELGAVIENALSAYLELQAWQVAHVEDGLRQADAGEFASEAELQAALASWPAEDPMGGRTLRGHACRGPVAEAILIRAIGSGPAADRGP